MILMFKNLRKSKNMILYKHRLKKNKTNKNKVSELAIISHVALQ